MLHQAKPLESDMQVQGSQASLPAMATAGQLAE